MSNELIVPERVTIEFSCRINNKLTSDLYILLHWKHYSNYKLPWTIKETTLENELALQHLETEGFIKLTGEKTFELRQKGKSLFEVTTIDQKWLEFLGTFPLKVPAQGGGTRPLKVASPISKANDKIKSKYLSIIKDKPGEHERIINVLKAEMKMRCDSSNMQYMNAMEAWLNQANYDKYEYLLEESGGNSNYENEDYM